jgi:hypothetical protein
LPCGGQTLNPMWPYSNTISSSGNNNVICRLALHTHHMVSSSSQSLTTHYLPLTADIPLTCRV